MLDLYLPESSVDAAAAVVVWSGGSAWLADNGKESAAELAPFFTDRGYAVAGVSVRSSAQGRFPAQLEDIDSALGWLRRHAAEHELDPERIVTMGDSSGGWVALMAALATDHPVRAVVDFYGPTDFLQMDEHMPDGGAEFDARLGTDGGHAHRLSPESRLVGGPIGERPEVCVRANPITYVSRQAPPVLILHGQDDPLVPHHQSELLFDALVEHGATATFYSLAGVKHERGYVTDASLARERLVIETRTGETKLVVGAPPPTWETIERFVAGALGH